MKLFATAVLGTLMGFSLSRIGFSDFGEVHRMFTMRDFRLLLTFAGAVVLTMVATKLLKVDRPTKRPLHPGTVVGGILFGIGWALTGACPAIALVQVRRGSPGRARHLGRHPGRKLDLSQGPRPLLLVGRGQLRRPLTA